jgi:hypothetical protein
VDNENETFIHNDFAFVTEGVLQAVTDGVTKGGLAMDRYSKILTENQEQTKSPPSLDTRQDDLPEDSALWIEFFNLIQRHLSADKTFLGLMIGFRGAGCRIRKVDGGYLMIKPTIDPSGKAGFVDDAEYKKFCGDWLSPYKQRLVDLLKLLRVEAEKKGLI